MQTRNQAKGYVLVGVLIVLVIIMILTAQYFTKDKGTGLSSVQIQLGKGSATACKANRENFSAAINSWMADHPGAQPTKEQLSESGLEIPRCPDDADYTFDSNGEVYCPIHFPQNDQSAVGLSSRTSRINEAVESTIPSGSGAQPPAAGTLDRVKRKLEKE